MPAAKLKVPKAPTPVQMPHKHTVRNIILMLPAILSVGWIFFINRTSSVVTLGTEGVFLAPVQDQQPLILSLAIFTIGYLFFLTIMFSEDIKAFLLRHHKVKKV